MSGISYRISFNVYDSSGIKIGDVEFSADGRTVESIEEDVKKIEMAMDSLKKKIQDFVKDEQ